MLIPVKITKNANPEGILSRFEHVKSADLSFVGQENNGQFGVFKLEGEENEVVLTIRSPGKQKVKNLCKISSFNELSDDKFLSGQKIKIKDICGRSAFLEIPNLIEFKAKSTKKNKERTLLVASTLSENEFVKNKGKQFCSVDIGSKTLIAAISSNGQEFIRTQENTFLEKEEMKKNFKEVSSLLNSLADDSNYFTKIEKLKKIEELNNKNLEKLKTETKYLMASFDDFLKKEKVSRVIIGRVPENKSEKDLNYLEIFEKTACMMNYIFNELKSHLSEKQMRYLIQEEKKSSQLCPYCNSSNISSGKTTSTCHNCSAYGHKDIWAARNIFNFCDEKDSKKIPKIRKAN